MFVSGSLGRSLFTFVGLLCGGGVCVFEPVVSVRLLLLLLILLVLRFFFSFCKMHTLKDYEFYKHIRE